jgi:hypothetical protein
MGLGTALFENNEFADGQISNANLSDYNVPAMDDMPATLSHELVEREGAEVQGLGETALPPVPPAVGNALYSLGIHVTKLPISAESVLDALDARDDVLAKAGSERSSTVGRAEIQEESVFASGSAREPMTSDGLPEGGIPGRAKRLLTSLPAPLLLLGTLGAGLVAVVLYRLLRRRGETKVPSVPRVLRR